MAVLSVMFRAVDEISAKFDAMTRGGERAVEAFEEIGMAANTNLGKTAQAATEAADALAETAESTEKTTQSTERARDSLGRFLPKLKNGTEGQREYHEENQKTNDAIADLSDLLVSAGIVEALKGIAQAFVETAKASIEFESAITGVYKTVDGTDEQLADISDGIKQLATEIPASTTEIAGVAEAAGQLGIATEDIMSFTEVMINLGEATNLSADEAASSLAKFANITGTSAQNYERLGSTIVALGNNFATTEADITAMATRMASAGTLAGMTESDILALAASLSSVGIEAEAGGSAMSTLMTKMQLAVETGNEQLEQFASVAGYTASDFKQAWGVDAAGALSAFISGLNDTERIGMSATAVLDEMGITEIQLSNAIKALANNSDNLNAALSFSAQAWQENTALATEAGTRYGTLESKLAMTRNAANNLSIAVGDVFNPVIATGSELLTDMLVGLTGFVEENPEVVAAVAAIATGVGVFAAALAAYTLATKAAEAATRIFNTTLKANPAMMVVSGVVALTAAFAAFAVVISGQKSEYDKLTETSKDQYDQLQELNAEYERACDVWGESDERTERLRYQLEDLNAEFEANKQTVEEFVAECDALIESHNALMDSYNSATDELKNEELGTLALIRKLEDLATQNERTSGTEEQMMAIIQELNSDIPGLALSYDDLTSSVEASVTAMREAAKAQAEQARQEVRLQNYIDFLQEQAELKDQIAKTQANIAAAEADFAAKHAGMSYDADRDVWTNGLSSEASYARQDPDKYYRELSELQAALSETEAALADIETEWNEVAEAAAAAAEAQAARVIPAEEAIGLALDGVKAEIEELCVAYDEAYEAARESLDSQIGLFEAMKTESSLSVEEMGAALESQAEYLRTYTENLQKASEYGIDAGLLDALSDGSAESAGHLAAMVAEIESLGGKSAEATAFVDSFNAKFTEVSQAKDTFAQNVAEMATNFDASMAEIETTLNDSIKDMNMADEARAAAQATISAYINTIRSMTSEAGSAAAAVAAAAEAHLGGVASTSIPEVEIPAHADGTTFGENAYIAGEEGPELILGAKGSTVFPTEETSRIVSAINDSGGGGERKISLEINGGGAISVSGTDRDTVLEMLMENLRPVLMDIIKEEIMEEGDGAYDY